ncbi:hypothetical protein C8R44DRAFT_807002, partial [Mycena epipterygia]
MAADKRRGVYPSRAPAFPTSASILPASFPGAQEDWMELIRIIRGRPGVVGLCAATLFLPSFLGLVDLAWIIECFSSFITACECLEIVFYAFAYTVLGFQWRRLYPHHYSVLVARISCIAGHATEEHPRAVFLHCLALVAIPDVGTTSVASAAAAHPLSQSRAELVPACRGLRLLALSARVRGIGEGRCGRDDTATSSSSNPRRFSRYLSFPDSNRWRWIVYLIYLFDVLYLCAL